MQMSPWDFSKQIILVTQDGLIFETFYEPVEMFLFERMPMQHYKGTSTVYLVAIGHNIHIKWQILVLKNTFTNVTDSLTDLIRVMFQLLNFNAMTRWRRYIW